MNVHGVGTIRGRDLFYLPHASERMWEQVEGGKYSRNTVFNFAVKWNFLPQDQLVSGNLPLLHIDAQVDKINVSVL